MRNIKKATFPNLQWLTNDQKQALKEAKRQTKNYTLEGDAKDKSGNPIHIRYSKNEVIIFYLD